jgi:hypothetical protein
MYNKEKIKKFHEYTLEDYNRGLVIEYIAKVKLVEKTDGSFTQIGIRPVVDEDIFISPSFHEELPGAGRMIAIGERDYLIKAILEKVDKNEIEKIEFKENLKEFPKHVYGFDNTVVLLSTKFYVKFFTELMHKIDYEEKCPRLDRQYRIIAVPEKVLGNKIILIDKNAVWWEKQKFHNEFTNKDEKIDFKIVPAKEFGKVDITIRSLNKIKHLDIKKIKILEVEESLR